MSPVSQQLQQLTQLIESLETNGTSVTEVSTSTAEPRSSTESSSGPGLSAQFDVELPLPIGGDETTDESSAFHATEATVTEDGSVVVSYEGEITNGDLEVRSSHKSLNRRGRETGGLEPHRDPEALREAYEQCDTFVEMKRALGTEVTPEAVRQQMVKHGIHEVPDDSGEVEAQEQDSEESDSESAADPLSRDEANSTDDDTVEVEAVSSEAVTTGDTDASAETDSESADELAHVDSTLSEEVFVSDGGLPVDLTIEELTEVLETSVTLFEASKRLSVEQDEARSFLKRMNLLDLVSGRLSDRGEQTVTRAEVTRRIRDAGAMR